MRYFIDTFNKLKRLQFLECIELKISYIFFSITLKKNFCLNFSATQILNLKLSILF